MPLCRGAPTRCRQYAPNRPGWNFFLPECATLRPNSCHISARSGPGVQPLGDTGCVPVGDNDRWPWRDVPMNVERNLSHRAAGWQDCLGFKHKPTAAISRNDCVRLAGRAARALRTKRAAPAHCRRCANRPPARIAAWGRESRRRGARRRPAPQSEPRGGGYCIRCSTSSQLTVLRTNSCAASRGGL